LPSQIELLVQLQQVDQILRANTQAVASGEDRVAELDDAYRAKAAATDQARTAATALNARQRDLEGRLSVAEEKMKDRRMRVTRIRNDKELRLRAASGSPEGRSPPRPSCNRSTSRSKQRRRRWRSRAAARRWPGRARPAWRSGHRARLGADIERSLRRQSLINSVDEALRSRCETILSRRSGLQWCRYATDVPAVACAYRRSSTTRSAQRPGDPLPVASACAGNEQSEASDTRRRLLVRRRRVTSRGAKRVARSRTRRAGWANGGAEHRRKCLRTAPAARPSKVKW
jgi:hypothetical protein